MRRHTNMDTTQTKNLILKRMTRGLKWENTITKVTGNEENQVLLVDAFFFQFLSTLVNQYINPLVQIWERFYNNKAFQQTSLDSLNTTVIYEVISKSLFSNSKLTAERFTADAFAQG